MIGCQQNETERRKFIRISDTEYFPGSPLGRVKDISHLVFEILITKAYDMAKKLYQSPGPFLLIPNLGCPFMPGFRYLLERYLVMSPIPDPSAADLSMRVL
jgi:hypothetical protein